MDANIPKPDWSEWAAVPRVTVWEACALSVDIDPHSMTANPDGWMASESAPFFDRESFPCEEVMKEFKKRERVLIANVADDSFSPPVINMGSPKLHKVRLDEFARWAVTKVKWQVPDAMMQIASPSLEEGLSEEEAGERIFNASFAETIYNENAINWRYWVQQMPSLTSAQASRLMSALDPDVFDDLDARPNRNDPSRMCRKAKAMQRLAEAEQFMAASPAAWLSWADERDLKVHDGFRIAVEGLAESQVERFTPPPRKAQTREDALTAVIDMALAKAPDPENPGSVWAVLIKFADEPETYPPLVGNAEGKVKIDTDNGIREFTKKNLRDRLARRKGKRATTR
jgi:hypothetical protein